MNREQLISEILDFGSDNLPVFGGKYEGGIHLQQNVNEIADLIMFLDDNKPYKNFLEVGSAAGGNTFILNNYFKFKKVAVIDDNKHEKWSLRNDILKDIKYYEYIGDSQSNEANKWVKDLDLMFDIIFIDADHSYEGVKKDTYNYIEFLNIGGYVIYHDYFSLEGIMKWVDEMKDSMKDKLSFIDTFYDNTTIFTHTHSKFPKGISVLKKIKE